jgi:hypothetical protein
MEHVKDVIAQIKTQRHGNKGGLVHDWRDMIPPGSRWQPGDPGNPACKICGGTGYVRLELPVGHPKFGKIFLCDCVSEKYTNIQQKVG